MLSLLLNIQCSKLPFLHTPAVVSGWINVVTRHKDEIFLMKTGKTYNQSLMSLEKQRIFELHLGAMIMVVQSGWLRWLK